MGNLRWDAVGLLGLALIVGGCTTTGEEKMPAGIAYSCDGHPPIRAKYDNGGARAVVWLMMEDGQKLELKSSPTLAGLRYMKPFEGEAQRTLVWDTDGGMEATLLDVAVGGSEEADRVVAKCTRAGWEKVETAEMAPAEHSETSEPH
jgi:hypothetical protein